MILIMTNIDSLIGVVRTVTANENAARYSGKAQLKVAVPKLEHYLFQDRPRIDWHSGIPNHLCSFTDSFDDDHCAAYVYVWEEQDRLKSTLRLSNIDGAHYAQLLYLSKSLTDLEIATRVVDSVTAGTELMSARGTIEQQVRLERGLFPAEIEWYSDDGL